MEAYSVDLRKRVLSSCDAGHKTKAVAELYAVSASWVRRLKQRRRELGTIAPLPPSGGPKPVLNESHRQELRRWLEADSGLTLEALRQRLLPEVKVCIGALHDTLTAMGWSLKKRAFAPPSRIGPTSLSGGSSGASGDRRRIRIASSSSTNRARRRT